MLFGALRGNHLGCPVRRRTLTWQAFLGRVEVVEPSDFPGMVPKNNSMSSLTCILNGTAGSDTASAVRDRLIALFGHYGVRANIEVAKTGSETAILAKRAVGDGVTIVVAAGGDGTVNGVASVLLNTDAVLGVIPLGTLNHFAKDLGIPLGLEEAVANLVTGRTIKVDVGEVNGRPFLNNSSLGLYPSLVRQREETQKRGHNKWLAFIAASFYVMWR